MNHEEQAAIVYDVIWTSLIEHDKPPTSKQIAKALGWAHEDVLDSIVRLRQDELLSTTTLNPTAYASWLQAHLHSTGTMLWAGSLQLMANGRLVRLK